jgi:hypothetical protein
LFSKEWEEKLNQSAETIQAYKEKYRKLKETTNSEAYLDQARSFVSKMTIDEELNQSNDFGTVYGSVRSGVQGKAGSVVSGVSGLAQHAKTLVSQMNNFNCTAINERNNGSVVDDEDDYVDGNDESTMQGTDSRYESKKLGASRGRQYHQPPVSQRSQDSNTSTILSGSDHHQHPNDRSRSRTKQSRSFREYSKSPKRVDV